MKYCECSPWIEEGEEEKKSLIPSTLVSPKTAARDSTMQVSRSTTILIFINFDNLNGKKRAFPKHKMVAAVAKLAEQLTDDSMFEA